jgi:hypothetical protein
MLTTRGDGQAPTDFATMGILVLAKVRSVGCSEDRGGRASTGSQVLARSPEGD